VVLKLPVLVGYLLSIGSRDAVKIVKQPLNRHSYDFERLFFDFQVTGCLHPKNFNTLRKKLLMTVTTQVSYRLAKGEETD
jgi:hypothetical protein